MYIMKFEELGFDDSLMDGLSAMNFKEMTPVQEQAIPIIMEGKDIIACAQTGTGKTAAYILPVLDRIVKNPSEKVGVTAIIMAPTRELAQQIDQQLDGFSYFVSASSVAVYGGNDASAWEQQKRAMQLGADFVIATPGRLISHISLDNVDFSTVKYFILDEADRMLDMGFYDDIIQIVKKLPAERQTIMFSATMPSKIKKLAENILKEPAFVNIAVSKPAEGVWQVAYVCYETQKLGLIMSLFKEHKDNKVVVFSSSKSKVKEVTSALRRAGMKVGSMHSDLEQNERDEVMLDFKSGKLNILIATDIISRGIDIDDIEVVVNYDVPHDAEDYIHRIGRTARANREGVGVTFVSEKDQPKFKRIENFIGKDIHKLPLPAELGDAPEYSPKKAGNRPDGHRRKPGNRAGQRRGGDRSDARDKNVGRKAETLGTERTNGAVSGDKPQNNRRKRWNKPRRKGNGGGAADVKQPQGE